MPKTSTADDETVDESTVASEVVSARENFKLRRYRGEHEVIDTQQHLLLTPGVVCEVPNDYIHPDLVDPVTGESDWVEPSDDNNGEEQ